MNTPQGWKMVKFSQFAKEKSNRINSPGESGYDRYVGLEHLDSGKLTVKRWGNTKDVNSAMKLFNKKDILFARRNTYLRRVSVAQFDGVCSGDIIVIEPILKEIVEGFLPIYMQFEPFESRVISLSAGAFSKRIKWKQLANEDVSIPPKEEQKKIVKLLWAIEDNIEKTENLLAINEKLKKGLLKKELFNNNYPQIPFSNKDYFKIMVSGIDNFEGTKEYLSTSSIVNNNIEFIEEIITFKKRPSRANMQPVENSVWFARMKQTNKFYYFCDNDPAINKYILSTGFVGVHCIIDKILPAFLFQIISSEEFQKEKDANCQGGVQQAINNTTLNKMVIPVPCIKDQKIILNKLNRIDYFRVNINTNLQNLKNLKKKLTGELLSGKLKLGDEK